MTILAVYHFEAGSVVAWLLVGLVAGWLAGFVLKGSGYGVLGDVIVGLVGAVIGGFLFAQFDVETPGFVGHILSAFVGACALIVIVGIFSRARELR
jgi:uncharacterized membrane protein YeaQ/YmgE (transglycosylase-associated protein family)